VIKCLKIISYQDLSDKVATREVVRVLGEDLRARFGDINNCLTQVSVVHNIYDNMHCGVHAQL
jgi:hypothetical protein